MGHPRSFLEFLRKLWKEMLDGATTGSYTRGDLVKGTQAGHP